MYKLQTTSKYKSDVKRLQKRGYDLSLLKAVVDKLANGEALPEQYHDHQLKGNRCDPIVQCVVSDQIYMNIFRKY